MSVVHAVMMGGIEIRIGVVCIQTVLGIHIVKRTDISPDNAVLFVMVIYSLLHHDAINY